MADQNKIQNLSISVDDGSIKVPINDKYGAEIGIFYFRPTDIGIVERYNKVVADFEKITAPLEHININPDGTADEQSETEMSAMKEVEKNLFESCNYLFGGNFADAFFGRMHPFSPVNGHFYCENALEAVGKFISKQFDREVTKISNRVNRYTHGYQARTGKHKDGKK